MCNVGTEYQDVGMRWWGECNKWKEIKVECCAWIKNSGVSWERNCLDPAGRLNDQWGWSEWKRWLKTGCWHGLYSKGLEKSDVNWSLFVGIRNPTVTQLRGGVLRSFHFLKLKICLIFFLPTTHIQTDRHGAVKMTGFIPCGVIVEDNRHLLSYGLTASMTFYDVNNRSAELSSMHNCGHGEGGMTFILFQWTCNHHQVRSVIPNESHLWVRRHPLYTTYPHTGRARLHCQAQQMIPGALSFIKLWLYTWTSVVGAVRWNSEVGPCHLTDHLRMSRNSWKTSSYDWSGSNA